MQKILLISLSLMWIQCQSNYEILPPKFEDGYVIEAYMQPNQGFQLLVSKNFSYFDPLDTNFWHPKNWDYLLENHGIGNITINEVAYPLIQKIQFDYEKLKLYNYTTQAPVTFSSGDKISLHMQLPRQIEISAHTEIPEKIMIDSMVMEYNSKGIAREFTFLTFKTDQEQYIRRRILKKNQDTTYVFQDYPLARSEVKGNQKIFSSGYNYYPKDTVITQIYSIPKSYYLFLKSVINSYQAAQFPFAQPGSIVSNVQGSDQVLGIFTGLQKSEKTLIIP